MNLKENTTLQGGKYRIIRVLGQGGFGITYLAEHTMLDKLVAIKEFFPKDYCDRDEENSHVTIGTRNSKDIVELLQGKFIKEAKNISKLRHPGIITIHDIFQENDTAYYVMEYVEGESLSEMSKRVGKIDEATALEYIRKIGEAVGYMHSKSMNHLDIKPANIMIRRVDNEPILIDFGLAKQYDASGGQTSTTPIGISHGYAPIEQYRPGGVAKFSPQTDIYSLGATLFALLTAQTPPHYSDILEDGLPSLPSSVSASTSAAIEKAMEVKKNKRPETIEEFLGLINNQKKNHKLTYNSVTTTIQEIRVKENLEEDTFLLQENYSEPSLKSSIESREINGISFIDLGLSVKWANMNLGAQNEYETGEFFTKDHSNYPPSLFELNQYGARIPTTENFQELIQKCRWIWDEDQMGYKVIGPNGNSIFLSVSGDNLRYPGRILTLVTFGLLWTNQAFHNYHTNENFLLYFNSQTYKLIFYKTTRQAPIRLII